MGVRSLDLEEYSLGIGGKVIELNSNLGVRRLEFELQLSSKFVSPSVRFDRRPWEIWVIPSSSDILRISE